MTDDLDRPGYTLRDAQEAHRENPDTFEVPDWDELGDVDIGDYVKLSFEYSDGGAERMWVKVTDVLDDNIHIGTLSNRPIYPPVGLDADDLVSFRLENVLDIKWGWEERNAHECK